MAMLEIRNVQKTFRTYAKPGLFHRPGTRKVASELPVLRGVDLTVEKGDVVAILGPSGSGKTTLLRCLNFLETADAGQLVFDGESFDLAHAGRADIARLRKKTAFVFQNYNLVPVLSVYENIVLPIQLDGGKVDQSYVNQVIEALGLEQKLQNLPSQLSGGQQQRISIARAILKDAPIVVFDEATSYSDIENEHKIQLALQNLLRGKTTIMIAHRLHTIRNADKIFVFQDGKVVEQGTHDELIASGSTYSHMWDTYTRETIGEE